jgi:outer membrane protein OmpA-like peptidoglycan-associated protein
LTRTILFAAALATSLAGAPAMAAPDPSVGDVIKALTVSPNRTRGSRPVQTPGAAPAAQTPGTATPGTAAGMARPPAAEEGSGAIDLSVQFAVGSAELTSAARKTLDVLGQALVSPQLTAVRVRIEGHTDTVGSDESNMLLSQRRAAAAAAYLEQQFHIGGTRLEAVGRGESQPLVNTGDNVDEPRNRRVHVVNISG